MSKILCLSLLLMRFILMALFSVYGVLRDELWGEATKKLQRISYVHSRETSRQARVKL